MGNKQLLTVFVTTFLMSFLFISPIYADTLGQPSNVHSDALLGQQETFFVNSKYDKYSRTQLTATLRSVSNKLYFYVEDNYWDKLDFLRQSQILNNISALADEFENNIYLKEVGLWGSEPNPGIDNDPRITILLEEVIDGNGGYFDTVNGYLRQQSPSSNAREMIALNVSSLVSNVDLAKVFLAHEFHHLASFNQKDLLRKVSEDIWLNELRAEYSTFLVGYGKPYATSNLKRRFDLFLENPSDSLPEWPNKLSDYAVVNAFGQYLVEQYGEAILSETLKNSGTVGIQSINEYLASRGYAERFEDIFGYWMAAMYLNDQSKNSRFGYLNQDLKYIHVNSQRQVYFSSGLSDISVFQVIKPWQPAWLEFNFDNIAGDLSKSVKLSAVGETGKIFSLFYLIFYDDGTVEFNRLPFNRGSGSVFVINSGKFARKILVMPTNTTKISDFGLSETGASLRIDVSMMSTKEAEASIVKDGSLIKRKGEKEIYVIWGRYKRYLNSGVISLYGHLDPATAIELEPDVFNSYQTANYVKYANDEKVYAVWPDGSKHWLDITPQQWDASNRDWNAIFTINDLELNYYKTGVDITR